MGSIIRITIEFGFSYPELRIHNTGFRTWFRPSRAWGELGTQLLWDFIYRVCIMFCIVMWRRGGEGRGKRNKSIDNHFIYHYSASVPNPKFQQTLFLSARARVLVLRSLVTVPCFLFPGPPFLSPVRRESMQSQSQSRIYQIKSFLEG